MNTRLAHSFRLAILVVLVGCGDSSGPKDLAVCTGPVQLHVGTGTTPKVSWTPACLANQLDISEQGGNAAWAVVFVVDSNLLVSPVHFGVAQSGAIGLPSSPAALTAGTTYVFDLWIDPVGVQDVQLIGTKNVTP